MRSAVRRALQRTWAITRKELLHIARDPRSLALALALPLLMLLMFSYALSLDVDRGGEFEDPFEARDALR